MNKLKKSIVVIILLSSIFKISLLTCSAEDEKSYSTTMSYIKQETELYWISIQIDKTNHYGTIYDGKENIGNQINKYQLDIDEKKEFILMPDNGYTLGKVELNGKDITNWIQNGKLDIKSQKYNQEIIVHFVETDLHDQKVNPIKKVETFKPSSSYLNKQLHLITTVKNTSDINIDKDSNIENNKTKTNTNQIVKIQRVEINQSYIYWILVAIIIVISFVAYKKRKGGI